MATDKKCLRCSGTRLQPGNIHSGDQLLFKPDTTKRFPLFGNNVEVRASICLDCGLIELLGDASKARSITEATEPN